MKSGGKGPVHASGSRFVRVGKEGDPIFHYEPLNEKETEALKGANPLAVSSALKNGYQIPLEGAPYEASSWYCDTIDTISDSEFTDAVGIPFEFGFRVAGAVDSGIMAHIIDEQFISPEKRPLASWGIRTIMAFAALKYVFKDNPEKMRAFLKEYWGVWLGLFLQSTGYIAKASKLINIYDPDYDVTGGAREAMRWGIWGGIGVGGVWFLNWKDAYRGQVLSIPKALVTKAAIDSALSASTEGAIASAAAKGAYDYVKETAHWKYVIKKGKLKLSEAEAIQLAEKDALAAIKEATDKAKKAGKSLGAVDMRKAAGMGAWGALNGKYKSIPAISLPKGYGFALAYLAYLMYANVVRDHRRALVAIDGVDPSDIGFFSPMALMEHFNPAYFNMNAAASDFAGWAGFAKVWGPLIGWEISLSNWLGHKLFGFGQEVLAYTAKEEAGLLAARQKPLGFLRALATKARLSFATKRRQTFFWFNYGFGVLFSIILSMASQTAREFTSTGAKIGVPMRSFITHFLSVLGTQAFAGKGSVSAWGGYLGNMWLNWIWSYCSEMKDSMPAMVALHADRYRSAETEEERDYHMGYIKKFMQAAYYDHEKEMIKKNLEEVGVGVQLARGTTGSQPIIAAMEEAAGMRIDPLDAELAAAFGEAEVMESAAADLESEFAFGFANAVESFESETGLPGDDGEADLETELAMALTEGRPDAETVSLASLERRRDRFHPKSDEVLANESELATFADMAASFAESMEGAFRANPKDGDLELMITEFEHVLAQMPPVAKAQIEKRASSMDPNAVLSTVEAMKSRESEAAPLGPRALPSEERLLALEEEVKETLTAMAEGRWEPKPTGEAMEAFIDRMANRYQQLSEDRRRALESIDPDALLASTVEPSGFGKLPDALEQGSTVYIGG